LERKIKKHLKLYKRPAQQADSSEPGRLTDILKKLHESEEKYRITFDTASSAIASIDSKGRIIEYNRAAAELFGVKRDEMLGKSFRSLMRSGSYLLANDKLKGVIKEGHSYGVDYKMVKKDGTVIDVNINTSAIYDEKGIFVRAVSVLQDVTEKKLSEAALKESEEKYRVMFESTTDAVFVFRLDPGGKPGKYIAVNNMACERLGYTREEFLDMTPADIDANTRSGFVREIFMKLMKERRAVFETLHRAKDGRLLPVEMNCTFFSFMGKTTVFSTARDITERLKTEASVREQTRIKELRAQIWKLAADGSLSENGLIQGLLDRLGLALDCLRVVYSVIRENDIEAVVEWRQAGQKMAVKGIKTPKKIFDPVGLDGQAVLDEHAIFNILPRQARDIIKPFVAWLIKRLGNNCTLATPIHVAGKREGLINCVAAGDGVKHWSDEKKQIVDEAAAIVSAAISSRRADENLKKVENYREIRAKMWRMATENNMTEGRLLQSLVDLLGPALDAERVVISMVEGNNVAVTHEWRNRRVPSVRNIKFPRTLFDALNISSQLILDRKKLTEITPENLRPVVRTITELLIKLSGEKPALITPFLVSGAVKGTINCVGNAGPVTGWGMEKKSLIIEAARITTTILERKTAEGKLLESEQRYRSLFEGVSDAVTLAPLFSGGKTGKFIEANGTAQALFGYSRGEFLGMTFDDMGVPGKIPAFTSAMKVLVKKKYAIFETAFRLKNGGLMDVELNNRLYYHLGKPAVLSTIRDISGRKKYEDNMKASSSLNELRAAMWKTAADKKLDEQGLVRNILAVVGNGLKADRAVFDIIEKDGSLAPVHVWKKQGIRSSPGFRIPAAITAEILKNDIFEINMDNVWRIIPDKYRSMAEPIIAEMVGKYRLQSIIVVPYRIDGRNEGLITLDIMRDNTEYSGWDEQKKDILRDLANIISQTAARIRAEKKIEESEKLYRELFNNNNDGVIVMDLGNTTGDNNVVDFNDNACRIFGLTRDEMKTLRLTDILGAEDAGKMRALMPHLESGGVADEVLNITTKKGRKITIEARTRIFDFGRRRLLMSVNRDITEKLKAEQAIKESEEKYRELFNNANDGIFINELDAQGRVQGFIEINDIACRLTGYTRDEFSRMTPRDITAKSHLGLYPAIGSTLAETGRATYEQEILKKDGSTIVVENNSHMFMLKGKPIVLTIMRDITERLRAGNALKESEELYRTLVNTSPDAVVMTTLEGKISFASGKMLKIHGYEKTGSLTARNIFDLVAPESKLQLIKKLNDFASGNSSAAAEYRALRRNGTEFDGEISSSILKDLSGRPKAVISTIRDVSERKRAEEALKESEEKFRNIISQTGQLIYEYDINTGIIKWDGAISEITGYTYEEFNREVSIDIWGGMIHPEDRQATFKALEKAQEECGKYAAEYKFRLKDGNYAYMEDNGVFIGDGPGRAHKMLGVIKDISFRKSAENALKESEEKFRTLSEQSLLGIAIIQEGAFKYFNNAFVRISGYPADEVRAWKELDHIRHAHPDDSQALGDILKKRVSGDYTGNYQYRIITKDRKIKWIDVYAKSVIYEGAAADFITQADITELKETEEKLKHTIDELKRSNEELEQFAYVASHDMQEPLRMVSSYVQLLKRRYEGKLGQDADDFIGYAVDGADRMQRLIKDLLSFSRIGTHKKEFQDVDMERVLATVKSNLAPVLHESGAVITYGTLPHVFADEMQVVQLAQNLISNSIKFGRAGEKTAVNITARSEGKMAVFAFTDNGIGIDKQYFEKIFVIFQRLHGKSEYPGTGIGLSICKKIVESYGGRIWLESEEGKGATFYFSLPAVKNINEVSNGRD
jgi:PAS domain S-box-containing protein